jgi:[protein-PII] uridylyltransferase
VESYLSQRQALIASATPGVEAARELARLTDEAVRELARAASSRLGGRRTALVALGGWGAGAMLPSSDLDILVLSEEPEPSLKPYVEAIFYPLWDAGLKVGHQVRNPRGQLRAMKTDLASCTASLTGRPIDGAAEWAQLVLTQGAREARKRSRSLLREISQRPRPGSPYRLEPELKEDAGGRRDYDELTWTAAVISGEVASSPGGLVTAGILSAEEYRMLEAAAEVVSAARFELGRDGWGAEMTLDAAEGLRSVSADDVQLALAQTALVLARVRRRVTGESAGAETPLTPTELFALLGVGEVAFGALEEAAQSGRLDEALPGFSAMMTLRRPGIGHELTVGAHSLRTAALVATMPAEGALARSREALEHSHTLQVAALAHDVGKVVPGSGHSERGAQPAAECAQRLGLSQDAADDVADLVRLHVELADAAARADLDDEDTMLQVAARIGRRELLAPLHLLTAADSIATGPAMWTPWKASLVGALVSRLDAALSDDVDGAGIAARADATRGAARELMADAPEYERAFLESASLRYLAAHAPEEVRRDARLVAELRRAHGGTEAHIAVSSGPTSETAAVTVVALDKPELLARTAGAMSLAGLDILSVDAYGSRDGVALDSFVVASATRAPLTTETFSQLERLVRAALRDRLQLKTRLAERRRLYPARTSGPVKVETFSAAWDTAVRVSAPDRPGLLHDLARAVSATELDIRWAKVLTVDGMALDTFHVVGPDGGPVDDPGVLGHLVMRLREIR